MMIEMLIAAGTGAVVGGFAAYALSGQFPSFSAGLAVGCFFGAFLHWVDQA